MNSNESSRKKKNQEEGDERDVKRRKEVNDLSIIVRDFFLVILAHIIVNNECDSLLDIYSDEQNRIKLYLAPFLDTEKTYNLKDVLRFLVKTYNSNSFNVKEKEGFNDNLKELLKTLPDPIIDNDTKFVKDIIDYVKGNTNISINSNDYLNFKKTVVKVISPNMEISTFPPPEDTFLRILNSLEKNDDGTLIFDAGINVFQYPNNKIYIRNCYVVSLYSIIKNIENDSNTVLIGQPGIGKTTLIYYIVYQIKKYTRVKLDRGKGNVFFNDYLDDEDKKELKLAKEKYYGEIKKYEEEGRININNGDDDDDDEELDAIRDRIKILVNTVQGNGLFIVKASKGGKKANCYIYNFDEMKFERCRESEITDKSIVITDTYGRIECDHNQIISISSPSDEHMRSYKVDNCKIIYYDSYSDEEIKIWFDKCIRKNGGKINLYDPSDEDFKSICSIYGNVPRQIYYSYIYEKYYGKEYWDYYTQLIEGVIHTCGYKEFREKYKRIDELSQDPLSNIIMKYKMKLNDSLELEAVGNTFVSSRIMEYVTSIIRTPKDEEEYNFLCDLYDNYSSKSLDNYENDYSKYILHMLIKQLFAYNICSGKYNIQASKSFLDIDIPLSIEYFLNNGVHMMKYIMNNSSKDFDFLVGDVFVKIIYDDDDNNDSDINIIKEIVESIKYCKSLNTLKYITIHSEELKNYGFRPNIGTANNSLMSSSNPSPSSTESNTTTFDENTIEEIAIQLQHTLTNIFYDIPTTVLYKIDYGNVCWKVEYTKESKELGCFFIKDRLYILRKCFSKIINVVKDDYGIQSNFIIFGNQGLGKYTLSELLNYYFIFKSEYNVLYIIEEKNEVKYYYTETGKNYCKRYDQTITPQSPYMVISYRVVIGEDDYADAKKIIVLYESYDENIKTYQNKRCPLRLFIPPFNLQETSLFVFLDSYDKEKELIIGRINRIMKYGGIPIYMNVMEDYIREDIKKIVSDDQLQFIEEMINGVNKSPLAKGYKTNAFIYNTPSDDVTQSDKLIFLSPEVEKLVIEEYIRYKTKNSIDGYIRR